MTTWTPPVIELVDGPNPWHEWNNHCQSCGRDHCCWFCTEDPLCYDQPMPFEHTLCARCGHLIHTAGLNDPKNDSMVVCPPCESEMAHEPLA